MVKLSVAIITKNEENNIQRCLKSINWADEIVVLDSGSTDETVNICHQFNCRVIQSDWKGFGKTKQLAMENTTNNWVLSIDADEVITTDLKIEIKHLLEKEPPYKGYRIRRNSFYLGKQIRHCGWDKDFTLRLFNKNYGRFNDNLVHESFQTESAIGFLKSPMLHYTYTILDSHIEKMRRYAELSAETSFRKGKKSSVCVSLLRGFLKFIKMYFLQLGFLDGKNGFLLSYNSGWGVYLKYLLLWEMNKSKSST